MEKFTMGQFVMNPETKDVIKISNGTDENGRFVPTEGIVLRVMGGTEKIVICYAHIKVDPNKIAPLKHEATENQARKRFESLLYEDNPFKAIWGGRI